MTSHPPNIMGNVFLVYMPPRNSAAMLHFRETIERPVEQTRLQRFLKQPERARIRELFGEKPVAVWGSQDRGGNRRMFDKMAEGDDLLIVEGQTIRFIGKIALKVVNPDLSRELWRGGDGATPWSLIYLIGNPQPLDIPFAEFCKLLDYEGGYQLRGLTSVSAERLEAFYDRYDDLYSILSRIRDGERIQRRIELPGPAELVSIPAEDLDEILNTDLVSDHVRMQWTLAKLGRQSGARVWVPAGDRKRLQRLFDFTEYESTFGGSIDLPPSVENIDVVWKEEFRIDAAFEVENSTSIYSGLLRFADLATIAPNTTYPLFIVAPAERRSKVWEQVRRPTFRSLSLTQKVKFLPYETVDEIQKFFGASSGGVTVEMMRAKAETMPPTER